MKAMLYALGVLLGLFGFGLASAGFLGLLSRATGWEMRTRGAGSMAAPTDLGLGLACLGVGLVLIALAWLLTREKR